MSRRPARPEASRRLAGGGAVRGRGGSGGPRRSLRGPVARTPTTGWSSCATRCPASASSSRSPTAPRATSSGGPTPSSVLDRLGRPGRGAMPLRRPGRLRRLRLPARRARPPARAEGRRRARAAAAAGRAGGRGGGRGRPRRRPRPALADPAELRRAPRRAGRHAQAPLARGGGDRRVPDREPVGAVVRRARSALRRGRRRLLAGAPGRARGARRHRARGARPATRRDARSTCTPASDCSRGSWPSGWGSRAGWSRSRRTAPLPPTPPPTSPTIPAPR